MTIMNSWVNLSLAVHLEMLPIVICSLIVVHLCLFPSFTCDSTLESLHENLIKKIKSKTHDMHELPRKIVRKSNKTKSVHVDGIAHFEIENTRDGRKINRIEKLFKNALTMKGMNFIYKRDMFWRTWREVAYSNGSKTTFFYKCSHIINTTCENCYGGGIWKIDEDPIPCPYEILSMVNRKQICVVNYTQINQINELCPSVSSLADFMFTCDDDNPIITMYRFTNTFTRLPSERGGSDICKGRESCDISTFYRIYDDYVMFRIMNSTDDVIYSKVMRHDKKNYACNTNCGQFDRVTEKFVNNIKNGVKGAKNIVPSWSQNGAKSKKTGRKKKKTTASPCRKLQTTTVDYEEIYSDISSADIE